MKNQSASARAANSKAARGTLPLLCTAFILSGGIALHAAEDPPFVNPNATADVAPIVRVPWGAAATAPRNLDEPALPAGTGRIQWRAWNAETFAEARTSGRAMVLFLTAPWCHAGQVMEHTALTDSEVINRLNEEFIPVRLNRDERPDVDMRLQQALGTLNGSRGWPLTVFLTSEGRIFHGATSYAREDDVSTGKAGLRTALRRVEEVLREGREVTIKESAEFEDKLRAAFLKEKTSGDIPPDCLDAFVKQMQSNFDEKAGGPSGAKFPTPRALDACVDHYRRSKDMNVLHVCTRTLTALLQSGMYDHLAGGFHRCCVDRWWRVPRFEKLLSFNAEMLSVCLHAWQESKSERYKKAIEQTVAYWSTLSDRESGLFFNAQTADVSSTDEGDYFTWTIGEIEAALRDETDCRLACTLYGITEAGNLQSAGACRNALTEVVAVADAAAAMKLDGTAARQRLEKIHARLLEARLRRAAPPLDRALYTDGNALMAATLLECGKAMDHPEWVTRGEKVLRTLLQKVSSEVGHVYAQDSQLRLTQDEATVFYACAIAYEVTNDAQYLADADASLARIQKNFWDEKSGCLLDRTEETRPEPIAILNWSVKPFIDSAEPSAAGLIAKACMKLHALTHKEEYRKEAGTILEAFGGVMVKSGAATLCSAADAFLSEPKTKN